MSVKNKNIFIDLSIIIINYDTNDLTISCISSIYKNKPSISFEIIVIDNASPNEDVSDIKNVFSEIRLIKNDRNVGFGGANNIGIAESLGQFILLLNSDTIVLDQCLDQCVMFMKDKYASVNNIGLIGCHVLNQDRTDQISTFGDHKPWKYFMTSNIVFSHLVNTRKPKFDFESNQFVSGIGGCFMMFNRDVFKKIRPFDPDFFMYAEETELCRNRVGKEFGIFYFSEAEIVHLGGGSSLKSSSLHQNMLSFALYKYKMGTMDYGIYLISTILNMFTNILIMPFFVTRNKFGPLFELKGYFKILPYLFFNIPRYSRKWGSRKEFLKF
jgi:hypothetical protein